MMTMASKLSEYGRENSGVALKTHDPDEHDFHYSLPLRVCNIGEYDEFHAPGLVTL